MTSRDILKVILKLGILELVNGFCQLSVEELMEILLLGIAAWIF
jgi:hypothetical protein